MGKRRRRETGKKRADKRFSVSSKCSEYGRYPGNVQGSTGWIYLIPPSAVSPTRYSLLQRNGSRDRLLSQSVSSYALLLHYFMFTQNSGLTHAFILIAAGLLLTMGVLRLLRYLRSRSRSRRGAWS